MLLPPSNNATGCAYLGDPRRPYPQDIEMRSGWLGRLVEGVPMETEQPIGDSNLQEFMQPSSSLNSQPESGLGKDSDERESVSSDVNLF